LIYSNLWIGNKILIKRIFLGNEMRKILELIVLICLLFGSGISQLLCEELEKDQILEHYYLRKMTFDESQKFIEQQKNLKENYYTGKIGFPSRILGIISEKQQEKIFINPPFIIRKDSLSGYILGNDIEISLRGKMGRPFIDFEIPVDKHVFPNADSLPNIPRGFLVNVVCVDSGDIAITNILMLWKVSELPVGWGLYKIQCRLGDHCLIQVKKQLSKLEDEYNYYLDDRIIIFVRGNIAVKLQSTYKNFGCMDLAQKIDTLLLEEAERQKKVHKQERTRTDQ
jgi:hypothetical protein